MSLTGLGRDNEQNSPSVWSSPLDPELPGEDTGMENHTVAQASDNLMEQRLEDAISHDLNDEALFYFLKRAGRS